MYCKYCGTQIGEGAQFCHSCGSKVEAFEASQPQEYTQVQPQTENAPETDYSSVTGTVEPDNQYYSGYDQGYYAQQPEINPEIEELKEKVFSNGLISAIFANVGVPFLGIIGIIFGVMTGKKVKKLKGMGHCLKGKTKAGEILGKVGLILGIVITAFWATYFAVLALVAVGAILIENSGGLYL